jgi:hypothetical protein
MPIVVVGLMDRLHRALNWARATTSEAYGAITGTVAWVDASAMPTVVGLMDRLHGALRWARETSSEAYETICGASAWGANGALAWVDSLGLRVARDLVLPIWYRLTPEVRMPLLLVSVSVSEPLCSLL